MSTMPRARRRGLLPPASALRTLAPLLLSVSVASLGCGDGDTASTPSGVPQSPAAPPAGELVPANTSSDGATLVPASSPAPATSIGMPSDHEAAPGDAKSIVDVWRLDNLAMSRPLKHIHEPPHGEWPGWTVLSYQAQDRAGNFVYFEFPFDGTAVSYDYANLSVAPSFVTFQDKNGPREWTVTAGTVSLIPLANGRARVELQGLEAVEHLGLAEGGDVRDGPPEPFGDGVVEGDVEPICIKWAPTPESAEPDRQRDDDWSSPFCAEHAP